ncbi:hypothetical protein D3C72_2092160 [compost metagenome]
MAVVCHLAHLQHEFARRIVLRFKMRIEAVTGVAAAAPQQQCAAEPLHGIRARLHFEQGVDGDVPAAGDAQRLQGIGKAWLFHVDDGARRAR